MSRLQQRYEELGRRSHRAHLLADMLREDGYHDLADQKDRQAWRLNCKSRKFKSKLNRKG